MKGWIRDPGLTMRMFLTMFLLAIIYLAFLTVLYIYGVGYTGLILFAGVFLFAQYYFSDKLVLYSSGARIVSEHEAPELYSMVRELSMNANLPMPKVAIVDTPVPNAFATGRNPKNAVVAVTTGLLRTLNYEEIKAVIGHELSHIKNRDVAVMTIASFLSTVAWFVMRWAMFAGMFGGRRENGSANAIIFGVSVLVWFISFLLIRALSRYREYSADLGSAYFTRNPRALISALKKISGKMELVRDEYKKEVEGLNAFYIIPALSSESILSLFSTHPPVEKRIERLEKISRELGLY
ncbi:Heat shock protein, Metallo peptidase, MEROPS family M48B [Archaeoglobus sulfaticallidus PM70-1]|uniref:Protease HtpX homolog n=1 Tax=Archaeoglobus sulfaticallidus PM70-1 TaxID=387631 RepID=N0BI67_9EURY|nr:zinc metalloprotease HtpX [Archaeoglobus sulfaticallidus]AGK61982.1 Heat shock protein, Metallo peptidase, MEROPS family M48B [Archaeoglobus sulfaticallidus PM70-1]